MEELKNVEMNNEKPEEIKEATATEEPTEVEETQKAEESSDSEETTKAEEPQKKEKPKRIEKISEKIKMFEPFLRLIEVVFIGVLSIAVAINANIIAKNQLKSEQMEKQPHFSVKRDIVSNDKGEENTTEKIAIKLTSGIAYDVNVSFKTVFGYGDYKIEIRDYYVEQSIKDKSDTIVELSNNNNYKKARELNSELNMSQFRICSIILIEYKDYSGETYHKAYTVFNCTNLKPLPYNEDVIDEELIELEKELEKELNLISRNTIIINLDDMTTEDIDSIIEYRSLDVDF